MSDWPRLFARMSTHERRTVADAFETVATENDKIDVRAKAGRVAGWIDDLDNPDDAVVLAALEALQDP